MATEEIITRYKIELDQLKAEVTQLTAQFGKIDDAADKSSKKTQKAFNDSSKSAGSFQTKLSSIGAGIAAAFSVQQVLSFAKSSIDGFIAAEKQAEKLKFSVVSLGKEGESAFQKLIDQSKKLSASNGGSLFGAGEIQSAQAMLVQFGLTTKQVEELTPAVLDLSAATGGDLNSAVTIATNALNGQTKGLRAIGADFKATGDFTKDYNKLLEELSKVSGSAAASTETTTGALKRQEEALNDVTDALGEKLAPAWVKFKTFGVVALDAIISGVDAAIRDFRTLFGLIGDEPKIDFKSDADSIALQALSTKELSERYKELKTSIVDLQKNIDNNVNGGKGLELQKQKLADLTAERDAVYAISKARLSGEDDFQNIISDTSSLNKKQLQDYIDGLKKRTDSGKKNIESEIESAQKRIDEIDAADKASLDESKQRREEALKKLQDLELSYSQQRKEALAKDELDLIRIKKDAALKQAQDQFNLAGGQSNPSAVSAFEKAKADIELIFAKEIADKKVEIAKEAADEMDKILDDLTKENERLVNIDYANFKKAQDDKAKAAEEAAERIKQAQQEAINNSIALVGTLFDIEQNLRSQRIADLEYQREQDREYADEKQVELQDDLNNRLITQAQYEKELTKLKKDRVAAEKAIQAKINAEKSKADKADKIRALFEIAINTAIGIAKTAAQLGYPAAIPFVALIAALGIAQTAAVASQPLPKYAEGTRYLDRNGNKRGKDTIAIMADEGERIIPRKQNVKHWKLYNSIDDGSFDKLIHDTYVLPALVAAQKKNQKHKQETFAENIAKSFIASATSKGTEFYDLQRLWNRGIKVTNLDDIISDDIKSPYR